MSSPKPSALVVPFALCALALGCGRSPAMPRAAPQLVRVESGQAIPCGCDDDDEADDDEAERRRAPVEYVRLSDWQPPASAERAAAEVIPRGDQPPSYLEFPELTLHRPIGETTSRRLPRVPRATTIR
ncbi:MAG: hypothetical protein KIS78_24595 [Labilithrix sp.]|nr:hypothetical protein [Labilithrix sp.]MCW5835603.1 hypothetical protein [Labilithrix sp.]